MSQLYVCDELCIRELSVVFRDENVKLTRHVTFRCHGNR